MEGIFCGDFSTFQNGLPSCRSAWHATCYTYHGATKFPVPAIVDETGNPWHKEEDRQHQMMQGGEGSHLCIPFQCKLCWYCNIEGKDPTPGRVDLYATCIRQANLDAMLGKSPLTIRAHRWKILVSLKNASPMGKTPAYHPRGPFPVVDEVGMSLAVDMLLKLLQAKGRILDHVQFATLRKMRGTYTKNYESLLARVKEGAAFANGMYQVRQTSSPPQSEWFHNFVQGLEYKMGSQSDRNHGLLMGAIVHILGLIKADAKEAEEGNSQADANELWKVGAYICILTIASLSGHKGFYVELAGLRKHVFKGRLGVVPPRLNKSTLLMEEALQKSPSRDIVPARQVQGQDWNQPPPDSTCQQDRVWTGALLVDQEADCSV